MSFPSAGRSVNLQEEGSLCKASLEIFTANVIARLGAAAPQADALRKHDQSQSSENIYFSFPFCFWDAFPGVSIEDLRLLALSGILWMSYMRAQDDVMDGIGNFDPRLLLMRDLYLRESLHLLYERFPHGSKFWELYSTYYYEYSQSVLAEKNHHSSWDSNYDDEDFHRIARGKAAMAKYPVAAQSILSGRHGDLHLLTESLDCFHIGYQYWDDVVDWKTDLANSNFTLLLVRARDCLSKETRALPLEQLRGKLGQVVYFSGLADDHLSQALRWLEQAYALALSAGCPLWAAHIERLQKKITVLQEDLLSLANAEKNRARPA